MLNQIAQNLPYLFHHLCAGREHGCMEMQSWESGGLGFPPGSAINSSGDSEQIANNSSELQFLHHLKSLNPEAFFRP